MLAQNLSKFPTWIVVPSKLARFMISFVTMTLKSPHVQTFSPRARRFAPCSSLGMLSLLSSCNSAGTKVKTPFDGKKYMSDARHFRVVWAWGKAPI